MDDFNKPKICFAETNTFENIKIVLLKDNFVIDKTVFIITSEKESIERIYNLLTSNIFNWYIRKTSPQLSEKGITVGKYAIVRFPMPKNLDINSYMLTNKELKYLSK
ncbi:MAG: hypothetical protein GX941_03500 [Candidatus Methanofastidiosa archaeon]|nr:hypothetical protein [Candidatus Methanofastidiosa archaeon]